MPGGIRGVKQMVADFHRRGVRVLFPMMMWDQGARDPGKPWPQAIAELMQEIGADVIDGDTQDGVPLAFSEAACKIGHPLAFEARRQSFRRGAGLERHDLGPYEGQFGFVPGVDRFRWLEPARWSWSAKFGMNVRMNTRAPQSFAAAATTNPKALFGISASLSQRPAWQTTADGSAL